MMRELLHRVIVKMRTLCPTVWPRVLMDGSSFQWVGKLFKFREILLAAVRWYCGQVLKLG
eukprot:1296539-Pyramimonas_sp.AAC.1